MRGSVFTVGTWMLLIAAGLLVVAGVLNVSQRAKHQTPPYDGVTWVDTSNGIIAKSVEPESAAARAYVLPSDRLIAIRVNDRDEEVVHARDVQMYLDQAHVGGEIHYLFERPSYPVESRYYWADLDNAAFLLFAPLFLHFGILYPTRHHLFAKRRWRAAILYIPAAALMTMG